MSRKTIYNFVSNIRMGIMGGTMIAIAASLLLAGSGGARESRPPAQVNIDPEPINRDTATITSFAPVVKTISPSVVNVFTTTKPKRMRQPASPWMQDPLLRRFFGPSGNQPFQPPYQPQEQHGLGSGVIVTEDGYILTNNHVVEGADEVLVGLNSGKKEYEAKVVGRDPKSDIAVLKIDATSLPAATLGDSDLIEVGDLVLALGNPFGVGQSVTMGIASATGRASRGLNLDYEDFIQTDAAINPGNSGGALVDAEGRLVGINTAILSRSGGNNGIGFAVPINLARNIMEGLIQHGRVVRGFLGVNIQNVTASLAREFGMEEMEGALVAEVMDDTPAEKAGLESGDVVIEFDGQEIKDSRHLKMEVSQLPPNYKAPIKVLRNGKMKELEVVLEELPGQELAGLSDNDESADTEGLKGVMVTDLDDSTRKELSIPRNVKGVLVTEVATDSAAYEAGLRRGNIIREINRKPVEDADAAIQSTTNLKDKTILLRVWNKGGSRYLVVDENHNG